MDNFVLRALAVGNVAFDVLQDATHGRVTGITSGGVFLSIDSGWVLFLSFADWRGPLILNLPPVTRDDLHVYLHSPFLIQASGISFSIEHIIIAFNREDRWSPPPRPPMVLPQAERAQRYAQTLTGVTAEKADRFEPGQDAISKLEGLFEPGSFNLSAVRTALASRQPEKIIAALTACLGSGSGLTPAGDDLALGFLLALNRWGDRLCPNLPPESINQTLIDAARHHTTALSASLIECAATGLADERLVTALDGLVSGNLAEDRIVDLFQGWGQSSGAAAMQGMGLVLICER